MNNKLKPLNTFRLYITHRHGMTYLYLRIQNCFARCEGGIRTNHTGSFLLSHGIRSSVDLELSWYAYNGEIDSEPHVGDARYSVLKANVKLINRVRNRIARNRGWSIKSIMEDPIGLYCFNAKSELEERKDRAIQSPKLVVETLLDMGFVGLRNSGVCGMDLVEDTTSYLEVLSTFKHPQTFCLSEARAQAKTIA